MQIIFQFNNILLRVFYSLSEIVVPSNASIGLLADYVPLHELSGFYS